LAIKGWITSTKIFPKLRFFEASVKSYPRGVVNFEVLNNWTRMAETYLKKHKNNKLAKLFTIITE